MTACYSGAMRLLLADDHPLFRLALAQAVRAVAPEATIAEAGSFDEAHAARWPRSRTPTSSCLTCTCPAATA